MRITPQDRLMFRDTLADTRLYGRPVYVMIPVVVIDNLDADTQSGVDVSDGDGTGRFVSWREHAVLANVRNVDQSLITFGKVPPGVEVGDVFLSVSVGDRELMVEARDNEHAYIDIDGDRWRIADLSGAGLGSIEEWIVTCERFSPLFIAPGH
ncbi:MAG TPA: hypothetical protein VJM51_06050 [Dehalococcoidia bacterium]|nr:hypothetical protein [Dehalococcoidia bacterium]